MKNAESEKLSLYIYITPDAHICNKPTSFHYQTEPSRLYMEISFVRVEDDVNQRIKELYEALMKKDSCNVIRLCQEKIELDDVDGVIQLYKLPPKHIRLTTLQDTIVHVATYSGKNQLVKQLLDLIKDDHDMLIAQNKVGDTILHEAAMNVNIEVEVACMMLDLKEELIAIKNLQGETPLFRAASFDNKKMFDFLIGRISNPQDYWNRNDGFTILHTAIQSEAFDLALEIARKYATELLDQRDVKGMTGLQVLSSMPAAFKSSTKYKLLKKIIYFCVPTGHVNVPVLGEICKLLQEMPWINEIWKEKRNHKSATELANYLIENDLSWTESDTGGNPENIRLFPGHHENENDHHSHRKDLVDQDYSFGKKNESQPETPLLLATSNGIVEIVEGIINIFPQAVEHVNPNNLQNILHVAVKNRKKQIFYIVTNLKQPMERLARRIDKDGNTLLHQVAFMEKYQEDSQPAPALQLQEELLWSKRVREAVPQHFLMHRNDNGLTATELFNKQHSELLTEAQGWLEKTSESCSVVAVLIATVAFAAAYTVPGGPNDKGVPVLLDKPFFLVFTVMDVISLASSLTSVVMFLSILTSPFHLEDFKETLPYRLTYAFTFLFISVAAMMLAFAATIILTIQTKEQSAKLLIYVIAFLPVSVFAFLQLPLYMALASTAEYTVLGIKRACSVLKKDD